MKKQDRYKLTQIEISGYKSIGQHQSLSFGDINLLIGANGSGKSNLVSLFQMFHEIAVGKLQTFIGKSGYAESVLYYGLKNTKHLEGKVLFESQDSSIKYEFILSHSSGGQMMFEKEAFSFDGKDTSNSVASDPHDLGSGHKESCLAKKNNVPYAKTLVSLLAGCRVFQFHDTSDTASIRQPSNISDNLFLHSDAGNLASYLFAMRESNKGRRYFERIESRIRTIIPLFDSFFLDRSILNTNLIQFNWRSQKQSHIFGVHQLSDGALRYIALATLLLQAPENLPNVIVIDEPELGLHPEALIDLVGMIKIAAENSQIILCTQSSFLLNFFDVNNVIVVDVKDDSTQFERLDQKELSQWIQDYSLADLWEKNILGGRP